MPKLIRVLGLGAHSFCWFCHVAAHILYCQSFYYRIVNYQKAPVIDCRSVRPADVESEIPTGIELRQSLGSQLLAYLIPVVKTIDKEVGVWDVKQYRKFAKYSDTQKICCNHSKIWLIWLYHREMSPNDADRMANSVDPDQTAPLGAVWSGSALFARAYLSENLGSLR